MNNATTYEPTYKNSHALVIGINRYKFANPLAFAENDARAISKILVDKFGFKKRHVATLLGAKVTADAIRKAYMKYTNPELVTRDDRLLVFFAGHGHTHSAGRREAGFLVPVEGEISDLSTLIRWDELTRNADLIPAKHILFLMDACYGGLAVTREIPTGRMRFMRDLLQRYARQVITAGKADEAVSDANGTRPGHSIFTSHLLDGLEGAAYSDAGTITAMGVMTYVYTRVGSDQYSEQTPHFGFIEGDGDFIFDLSPLAELGDETKKGEDVLVKVSMEAPAPESSDISLSDQMKVLIPSPSDRIQLDDLVSRYVRRATQEIGVERFPVQNVPVPNGEMIAERLKDYEHGIDDLVCIAILLARWGDAHQVMLLEKLLSRLAEVDRGRDGYSALISLGWYPANYLMYAAGIAALSAKNFQAVKSVLLAPTRAEHRPTGEPTEALVTLVTDALARDTLFKSLPGHERQYAPRSEYLFKMLQAPLEDELYLGRDYESHFDKFEILWALAYADMRTAKGERVWGPPGRFAWKHASREGGGPYAHLLQQAKQEGAYWGPISVGMFGGNYQQFERTAHEYLELLNKLNWW